MDSPYIGVTGFRSLEDTGFALTSFQGILSGLGRARAYRLMVGVMMSFKTLTGLPTKWAEVFPPKEGIADIFIEHSLLFNALHYADYDDNTELSHLLEAVSFGGEHIQGLQLDMVWPDPGMVIAFRKEYPDVLLVLQVNGRALEIAHDDPMRVVSRLAEYGDSVDFVLLDKSMGQGLGMDAEALIPFAHAIRSMGKRVAVAGGLGPDSLNLVEPLARAVDNLSIDAQSKVCDEGDAKNPLRPHLVHRYLDGALRLLSL